ncbi:DUF5067 domain-containing protein [Macrococcus brunensis]|uniref:DUF5067 domain-containing protein n=1 Tax=Macrococcus brunensis TaxID=198483 RepID=UPI001EF0800E|nr:DUF5067 domain-containing protein [Macrococcus brunensis]ULG70895.1 DUF5067 domain-containing protein [Macrococcus brunensis]
MNYKLLSGTLLASSLLLTACGQAEETAKDVGKKVEDTAKQAGDKAKETADKVTNETATTEAPKKDSSKDELKDKTAVLDDIDVKILETELMPKGTYEHQTADQLVVTYEVTNKSDKEINPMTGYLAAFEATQEDANSERKLQVGMNPMNDKYSYVTDVQMNNIKKGGTVKSAVAYDLKDMKTSVVLHASKGIGGEKLGTITVELKK